MLLEYCQQLNCFIEENKGSLENDNTVQDDFFKAKENLTQVKVLFPAAVWRTNLCPNSFKIVSGWYS